MVEIGGCIDGGIDGDALASPKVLISNLVTKKMKFLVAGVELGVN